MRAKIELSGKRDDVEALLDAYRSLCLPMVEIKVSYLDFREVPTDTLAIAPASSANCWPLDKFRELLK